MTDLKLAPSAIITATQDLAYCAGLTFIAIILSGLIYGSAYYIMASISGVGNSIGEDVVFNVRIISPCVSFLLISIICHMFPKRMRSGYNGGYSIDCEKHVFSYRSFLLLLISLASIISYQFVIWSATSIASKESSVFYGPKSWTYTTIFIILLVAPLSEEMFFRFTLWRSINNKFLMPPLITFWMFLLYHYTVGTHAVILALFPSVILTFLRRLNHGIVYSSIAHITNNASRYILFSGIVVFN